MATYDIKEERFNSQNEMIIEIDNSEYKLTYTANGPDDIEYQHPTGVHDTSVYPVQVFVLVGEPNEEENPNPLIFNTSMTRLESGGKKAQMYCMATESGNTKEKKRRKTNVTVSSGGGLGS